MSNTGRKRTEKKQEMRDSRELVGSGAFKQSTRPKRIAGYLGKNYSLPKRTEGKTKREMKQQTRGGKKKRRAGFASKGLLGGRLI